MAFLAGPDWAPDAPREIRAAVASVFCCQCVLRFLEFEQAREHVYDFGFRLTGYIAQSERQFQDTFRQRA
eukprot:9638125-Lingulodinium_polyedra.AAC.1